MMKVLITGADGQLGKELQDEFHGDDEIVVKSCNRRELDITDFQAVEACITDWLPDVIINTAAFNDVDGAETNVDAAYSVNALGSKNLAVVAEIVNAKLVQISSDFIFHGDTDVPYKEYDAAQPLSVYGASKLQGESEVKKTCSKHFIVRTSWLYSMHGQNFVKAIIQAGLTKIKINVVMDQTGSPTNAKDLAGMLHGIITTEKYGTYHFSNNGFCSRYEFTREIFRLLEMTTEVIPITSDLFDRAAIRPTFSTLDTTLVEDVFSIKPRQWKDALSEFINENAARLKGEHTG